MGVVPAKSRSYESFEGRRTGGDTGDQWSGYKVEYRDAYLKQKVLALEAIPVFLRYNINSFLVAGAGALVGVEVERSTEARVETYVQRPNGQGVATTNRHPRSANGIVYQLARPLFADLQIRGGAGRTCRRYPLPAIQQPITPTLIPLCQLDCRAQHTCLFLRCLYRAALLFIYYAMVHRQCRGQIACSCRLRCSSS